MRFLSGSGDSSAHRELLVKEAIEAKSEIQSLQVQGEEAENIKAEIIKLIDEIIALTESKEAIQERIKKINELLDRLIIIMAESASKINIIKTELNDLNKQIEFYENKPLSVNPIDQDYVRNYDADRRIVQMLVYLVTPKDQGGGGFERLKVKTIKFSYDTERKSISGETEYQIEQGEEPNVSAHFTGQAADITEIDCIKCSQIERRRLLSDKKTKLPPIPIKVAWQTEEGYLKSDGTGAYGQNMHQVFKNLGSGSIDGLLAQQIGDLLGIEIDPAKLHGASFGELAKLVGIGVLRENFDLPGEYNLGSDFGDFTSSAGRALLAQALGVPEEGIRGSSPEDIFENVGRAMLEEKMQLPSGSLAGKKSNEIFASAGRRKLEESLGLSRDALAVSFNDSQSFKRALGQGRIEAVLGIKPQSFSGDSINEVKRHLGKEVFQYVFANPEVVDNILGIPTLSTQKLLDGSLSPNDYSQITGDKVFNSQIAIYQRDDKRAEAFGVGNDDLQSLISGDSNALISIGKTTIAQAVSLSEKEQGLLRQWFDSHSLPSGLDQDWIAGQYGLKAGDLERIFLKDSAPKVYERFGQMELLGNVTGDLGLDPYLEPAKDIYFYLDRLDTLKDNLKILERSDEPEISQTARETLNIIDNLISDFSTSKMSQKITDIQINLNYMRERAGAHDPTLLDNIDASQRALNEMIESKEFRNFGDISSDEAKIKSDPKTGLTRKDVLAVLTGQKKPEDLIYQVGLKKWEIEFGLPDNSLNLALKEFRSNGFQNQEETILISLGKARIEEYGGLSRAKGDQTDKDLGLRSGTTADFRSGKITENAYYIEIGEAAASSSAANLLNRQFGITDPSLAIQGTDISRALSGSWFWLVAKIGGVAVDDALDLPQGGTLDILAQSEIFDDPLGRLAEQRLGLLAGLSRPVSKDGDLSYNLGRVKLEQYLNLKPNELNDNNLADMIGQYVNDSSGNLSPSEKLSRLDVLMGVNPGDSAKAARGEITAHDYIAKIGGHLKNSTIYNQIARFAPALQNQELKDAVLALAERTGTPQEILEASGARKIGQVLGLDFPVSIRGNFKDNVGQGKIEDRLGLPQGCFRENFGLAVWTCGGEEKFEKAFRLDKGQLYTAHSGDADAPYWNEKHKQEAIFIDAILNIPAGSAEAFIRGQIDLPTFVDRVGQSSLLEVSVDKLADLMELDDKYIYAAESLVAVLQTDPSLSKQQSQIQLFNSLMGVAGLNLDSKTQFDPGTWEKILFTDPDDPEHTGLKNADEIVLEQGKKWLPRWLGMEERYEPYIDLIYEKASGIQNERQMTAAIREITGIPNDQDAQRFLNGDIRGGITAWGAAKFVKMYNEEFGGQLTEEFQLTYDEVKTAYFNDPDQESFAGDYAVNLEQELSQGATLSDEYLAEVRTQAIRDSRQEARKSVQFKAIDIQLHKLDNNIPAGFTQAMREGTSEQKWQMGIVYVGNQVHSQNPDIPAEMLPELKQYFDSSSPLYHNPEAFSNATYSFVDEQMQDWFGDFVQPGTAQALFKFGKTGQLGQPNEQGTLANIYTDYGINIVTNWADNTLDLPSGTTLTIYNYFTEYQQAVQQYQVARRTLEIAQQGTEAYKAAQEAVTKSGAAVNQLKGEAISFVVQMVFKKQLAEADQKLGLVPGTSAMLVGMIITGFDPVTVAIMVAMNLFMVYQVDVTCSACGYYPEMGPAPTTLDCPLATFDGASENSFRRNSILAAQYKVNKLLGAILEMPKALKDENMLPTQFFTLREEDVNNYSYILETDYGPANARGNAGLWPKETMWDKIHIGY
ncbi:MAG: hypothetical protein AAB785_03100 [Patescibacteria group bacterium]